MDSKQSEHLQQAAAFMAATLRNDVEAVELLQQDFTSRPDYPEALLYLAIVAAETWRRGFGTPNGSISEVWPLLPESELPADAAAHLNRAGVTRLATSTSEGGTDELVAARAQMSDAGVFALSAYDLVVACLRLLERDTGMDAAEWCTLFAQGSAGGIGVE